METGKFGNLLKTSFKEGNRRIQRMQAVPERYKIVLRDCSVHQVYQSPTDSGIPA